MLPGHTRIRSRPNASLFHGAARAFPPGAWIGRVRWLARQAGTALAAPGLPRIVLCMVTIIGLIERLWRLGEAPDTLNTDELVATHTIALILHGHGPGLLALDANGQLALGAYVQACSMQLFGDSTWALRLPAALLGTIAIPLF